MEIERHTEPFTHWIIYDLLTVQMIDEIYSVNPTLTADTNKCRSYFYFTPDNISSYPHMESFVNNFIGFKPLLEKYVGGKIVHHEFVEKTRTDKKGIVHPNNKYIVVLEK